LLKRGHVSLLKPPHTNRYNLCVRSVPGWWYIHACSESRVSQRELSPTHNQLYVVNLMINQQTLL